MNDKASNTISQDTKEYLRELISHYDQLLCGGKVEELNSIIQEERTKCINKLYRLRVVDM